HVDVACVRTPDCPARAIWPRCAEDELPLPRTKFERLENFAAPDHLREPRVLGKRVREVPHATCRFTRLPEVVRAPRKQGVGADRRLLHAQTAVLLDGGEETFVADRDLVGLRRAVLGLDYCDAVGLRDGILDTTPGV